MQVENREQSFLFLINTLLLHIPLLGCDFFSLQMDTQIRGRTGGNIFFKIVSYVYLWISPSLPGGTVGYPAEPGLIRSSVILSVSKD